MNQKPDRNEGLDPMPELDAELAGEWDEDVREIDEIDESEEGEEPEAELELRTGGYYHRMQSVYEQTPDEQLIHYARMGDNDAQDFLLEKYKNLVRSKVRSYFLIGADRDDIMQEGMIGLYKAIRDFRPDKQSGFRAFAELCVTRQIITAIKTATRQKHIPLNSYVSLNKPIYDEESERTLMDIIAGGRVSNPEELVINQEDFASIENKIGELLSEFEWKVLSAYLAGESYQQIAKELGRHAKSIDNALQRVKRKLEKYLRDKE